MKAELVSLGPLTPTLRTTLDSLPAILGRGSDADIRLGDRWISRIHCEISEISGTLVVRDLESRHGTLVNGQYVAEAHLLPGDRLTVGLTSFEVKYRRRKRNRLTGGEDEVGTEPLHTSRIMCAMPQQSSPFADDEWFDGSSPDTPRRAK
jgi:pSer/pThr/pTyr-binding forkhead associated (FHA) protein